MVEESTRFPDVRKVRRGASGFVVGALNEYQCGCAITRDSAGGVFLSACTLHNSAPALYTALLKAKKTIRALHGESGWEIYDQHSPEMKTINNALALS